MCKLYELPQMKESCKMVDPEFKPNFTYIVIQKRVNVRFYAVSLVNLIFFLRKLWTHFPVFFKTECTYWRTESIAGCSIGSYSNTTKFA